MQHEKSFAIHFLTSDEAQKAIKMFYLTFILKESETSLSFLAMFDAIITKMADLFQYILQ